MNLNNKTGLYNIRFSLIDDSSFSLFTTVIITNLYEGIPQTLILNLIVWVFLILLFTLLRQQAWDYGRLALVNSVAGKKWTQIFYAHGNNQEILDSLSNEMSDQSPSDVESSPETPTVRMHRQQSVVDSGFFSWIIATWKLRRDQILRHSGPDACHYLSFQQHLIIVMSIITFVSIVIILPINFTGSLSGDINSFSHTTIANLEPGLILCSLFFLVCNFGIFRLVSHLDSHDFCNTLRSTRGSYNAAIERTKCIQGGFNENCHDDRNFKARLQPTHNPELPPANFPRHGSAGHSVSLQHQQAGRSRDKVRSCNRGSHLLRATSRDSSSYWLFHL